jgi:hypothetical protein
MLLVGGICVGVTIRPTPQNDGLQGDRELPEQVAIALPVPASQESGRIRRA